MVHSTSEERSKILLGALSGARGECLETVGAAAGYGDVLESLQNASAELARFKTVPEVAEHALRLAVELTRSTVAFLALAAEGGEGKRVYTTGSDPTQRLPEDAV